MANIDLDVAGNYTVTNVINGANSTITSDDAGAESLAPWTGSKYGGCVLNKPFAGVGPAWAVCHFKLSGEKYLQMQNHHVDISNGGTGDPSWAAFVASTNDVNTQNQAWSVMIGLDRLTGVHYSFQEDENGCPTDNSASGVLHVTHIYPSVLDLYSVWVNNNGGGGIGGDANMGMMAGIAGIKSAESYIEFVNVPSDVAVLMRKFFNKNNNYSAALAADGQNLYRTGHALSGHFRPELGRQGALNTASLPNSGATDITGANYWDGAAVIVGATEASGQNFVSLQELKNALPVSVDWQTKAGLPPPLSVLNAL